MYSLCGIPQVDNNNYNTKLYKTVKIGCNLAAGCKILSLRKMCSGEDIIIVSYKIRLLKYVLFTFQYFLKKSSTCIRGAFIRSKVLFMQAEEEKLNNTFDSDSLLAVRLNISWACFGDHHPVVLVNH